MATIEVKTESETARGWEYGVALVRDSGERSEHTVRLSWADHEHWSGGRDSPSRVVEMLLKLLLEQEAERPLPERFDASTVRRWWPGVDAAMRGGWGGG